MDELVRQCVNNYFEKCDFKNKLTNFCTKYAFFTISQLKLNPPPQKKSPKTKSPASPAFNTKDDAVLLIL